MLNAHRPVQSLTSQRHLLHLLYNTMQSLMVAVLALAALAASASCASTGALRGSRQAIVLDPFLVGSAGSAGSAGPAQPQQPFFRILKQSQDQDLTGNYRYSFETENGISAAEEGSVVRPGSDGESTVKQGSFSYTGPDGVLYTISYIADDNGFRASGAHLPTPPPVPEAIQRSLELNAKEDAHF